METLRFLRGGFERLLELIVVVLVVALTTLVVCGATFRYTGHALTWYDEVASVGLVWLTFYGSALAALKGAHIGVPGLVNAMLRGGSLVSLPEVPLQLTQSVIPVGSILFMIAEALRLPQLLREAAGSGIVDSELKEALEHAEQSYNPNAAGRNGQ